MVATNFSASNKQLANPRTLEENGRILNEPSAFQTFFRYEVADEYFFTEKEDGPNLQN